MIGDLLFLISLAILAQSLGACCWRAFARTWPTGWQWPGLALPLGLGLMGLALGLAASFGVYFAGLCALIILVVMSAFVCTFEHWKYRWTYLNVFKATMIQSQPGLTWSLLILVAWLGLHAPVTDGDALCYHLEVAKRIAQNGSVTFDPDLHETAYPLLVESLQAAALLLRGPVATRAMSFLFGLSLSASAILLAVPMAGHRNAIWAGVILLTVPIVNCGMIAPLNDVPLAAFCASSLVVLGQNRLQRGQQVVICGLFCGLACGVKFPGIVWSAVMGLVLCQPFWKIQFKHSMKIHKLLAWPSLFVAILIASGSFWYVRAAVLTGNPVHPYFKQTFGGHGLDEVLEDARKTPLEHVWNIATAPVRLSLNPSGFDSFSHQIGPIFLATIPLGFLSRMPRYWYHLLAIGWIEMAICLTQRQSPRFYIATLAPWSAAAAVVGAKWCDSGRVMTALKTRSVIIAISGCLILLNLGFNMARVRHSAMILTGFVSPSEFLIQQEPTAKLAKWVDVNLPPGARLVGQDHRGFYWPRSFTMEKAHRRRTGLLRNTNEPEIVISRLLEAGFTHVVMAEPEPMDAVEFDPDLSIALQSWLASHTPLLDETIQEPDGYQRRYRIYQLKPSRAMFQENQLAGEREQTDAMVVPAGTRQKP